MEAKVIEDRCIGCGQCEATCPDVFRVEDDGVAHVVGNVTEELNEKVQDAAAGCPTDAIEVNK